MSPRSLDPDRAAALAVGQRVLVVGGAGYIGSILTRRLLDAGYRVRVLDALFYGRRSLAALDGRAGFELQVGDTRDEPAVLAALADVDAVVHLAELVGDPACAVDPRITEEINFDATYRLASLARRLGIRRFVYPSSCSVYGATDAIVDEESALNPVSLYAETKVRAERALRELADERFEPVILRLATVFGLSHRPRFDLVVNLLAARAVVDGEVTVFGGAQWRPFIHAADAAAAMHRCITAPAPLVAGRTFNVGFDRLNHTIGEVGDIVLQLTPEAHLRSVPGDDARDYRVSFTRAADELGLEPTTTVADGVREIQAAIRAGEVTNYQATPYSNVRAIRESPATFRIAAVGHDRRDLVAG
jgi:nucleoside-diphosphate-sugar epimerase